MPLDELLKTSKDNPWNDLCLVDSTLAHIKMVEFGPSKTLKIHPSLSAHQEEKLCNMLREHLDVFAWSYKEMKGVHPSVWIVLGHTISQEGLQVDPNKIAIIKGVPTPQKQRDVRSFLSLAGYYRRFIKYFSKVASPLFGLLERDFEFCWSENCQEALEILKDKLTTAPILKGQNWALPFHIHVYASNKAIEVALG
eukprot:PITA_13815